MAKTTKPQQAEPIPWSVGEIDVELEHLRQVLLVSSRLSRPRIVSRIDKLLDRRNMIDRTGAEPS